LGGGDKHFVGTGTFQDQIESLGRAYFVPVREIDYVEAAGNYVKLHVRGVAHPVRTTVRSLLSQLDPQRFSRIHKSTIVNVERVREVQPWFGGDYVAILHDGTQLRVSRTYVQDLLKPFR
jgi:two-component system LytT family response regulator